jgi:hypothetical protein
MPREFASLTRRIQELRKQFETISELRTDIKSLQADNLKLYEKIRYMQSYQHDNPMAAGPSAVAGTSYSRTQASTSRGDDLGKYRSLYEQNMNPFEAFRGRVGDMLSQKEMKCSLEWMKRKQHVPFKLSIHWKEVFLPSPKLFLAIGEHDCRISCLSFLLS